MAEMPPILVTEGCATSTARVSNMRQKSSTVPLHSPAAIGTGEAARMRAIAGMSSGGQIGSSTQAALSPATSSQNCAASCSVFQAQLMSSISGVAGAAACAARMQARSTSCSLMWR